MTDLSWVQWPVMAVTVGATWLVASKQARRRCAGFWLFLLSNLLWIAWALPEGAWALLVLQLFLAAMNVNGARQQAKCGRHRGIVKLVPLLRPRRRR